jgi:hypothetical protein
MRGARFAVGTPIATSSIVQLDIGTIKTKPGVLGADDILVHFASLYRPTKK